MPRCCSSEPRKKLPPPITTATWAPSFTTSAIWRAPASTTVGSTPTAPPPNISPPSLSSTRRKPGRGPSGPILTSSMGASARPAALAHLEPGELLDRDAGVVQQRLDGLLGVLHRRLLEEHDIL